MTCYSFIATNKTYVANTAFGDKKPNLFMSRRISVFDIIIIKENAWLFSSTPTKMYYQQKIVTKAEDTQL